MNTINPTIPAINRYRRLARGQGTLTYELVVVFVMVLTSPCAGSVAVLLSWANAMRALPVNTAAIVEIAANAINAL